MEFPPGQNPPDKLPVDTLPVCAEKCKRMRLGVLERTVFSPLYSLSHFITVFFTQRSFSPYITTTRFLAISHIHHFQFLTSWTFYLVLGFWYTQLYRICFGCCLGFKQRFSVQGVARSGHNIVNPSWFFWILWEASHTVKRNSHEFNIH